ncbi:MAG: holo-ACP synthase [Zoogloeaceae bacterium]|jgi:holo-[acyl-carrier protein] synthase|nr:holo-ACP synthase [Zoogloeaceae bacterium]
MIYGIGVDIVAVARLERLLARHGDIGLEKILARAEREAFRKETRPGKALAKRWAAKEAFGKALGTGLRPPATLSAIAVAHDDLGKPRLVFAPELAAFLSERGITAAHLSISDEAAYAIAHVILETA